MKPDKIFFEYLLTPRSTATFLDMYNEGIRAISFITNESIGGIPSSRVNRYSLNVGTRKIEISLENIKIPEKIIQKLSQSWNIQMPCTMKQYNPSI